MFDILYMLINMIVVYANDTGTWITGIWKCWWQKKNKLRLIAVRFLCLLLLIKLLRAVLLQSVWSSFMHTGYQICSFHWPFLVSLSRTWRHTQRYSCSFWFVSPIRFLFILVWLGAAPEYLCLTSSMPFVADIFSKIAILIKNILDIYYLHKFQ